MHLSKLLGIKRLRVSSRVKPLAELAAWLCLTCKPTIHEILDCDQESCGIFEMRSGKARFKQLLVAMKDRTK
jgi:hypothetical protein